MRVRGVRARSARTLVTSLKYHCITHEFENIFNRIPQILRVLLTIIIECYEILNSRFALEHRYLLAGNDPICYARIPAVEFIKRRNGGRPYWINLKADPAYHSISNTTVPGSVLLNVGFCPLKSVDDHDASWQKQRQEALTTSYYELRVHVYQASDLPPADDDGSLDPYLKIKFADQKANWKRRYIPNTRDPVWYVVFDHSISNSLLIRNKTTQMRILNSNTNAQTQVLHRSLLEPASSTSSVHATHCNHSMGP